MNKNKKQNNYKKMHVEERETISNHYLHTMTRNHSNF